MQNRQKKTSNGQSIKRSLKRALKYLKTHTDLLEQKQGSTEEIVFETLKQFLGEVSDDLRAFHDAESVKEWREKFDSRTLSQAESNAIALVYEPNGSQGNPDFWVAWNYRYISLTVKSSKTGTVKWNSGLPEGDDICIFARTTDDKKNNKAITYVMGEQVYSAEQIQKIRAARENLRNYEDEVEIVYPLGDGKTARSYEHFRSDRMDDRNWNIPPFNNGNPQRESNVEKYIDGFNWGIPLSESNCSYNLETSSQIAS